MRLFINNVIIVLIYTIQITDLNFHAITVIGFIENEYFN